MRVPSLVIALALTAGPLAGCLLDEQDCGRGFELVGNRCVPAVRPPPRGDLDPPDGDAGRDAASVFEAPAEGWAPFVIIALLDRTPADALVQTPATPGADLDAITVFAAEGDEPRAIGAGAAVVELIGDGPERVTGAPDGVATSLGTAGGRIFVRVDVERPLASGDLIAVHEVAERGGERDAYVLFACRAPLDPMEGCRQIGAGGPGVGVFELP